LMAPDKFRGRVMGVFQLSNRGLNPLGQTETGLVVPLIGARETALMGGLLISGMTLLTIWRVPGIVRFRWHEKRDNESGGNNRAAISAPTVLTVNVDERK